METTSTPTPTILEDSFVTTWEQLEPDNQATVISNYKLALANPKAPLQNFDCILPIILDTANPKIICGVRDDGSEYFEPVSNAMLRKMFKHYLGK